MAGGAAPAGAGRGGALPRTHRGAHRQLAARPGPGPLPAHAARAQGAGEPARRPRPHQRRLLPEAAARPCWLCGLHAGTPQWPASTPAGRRCSTPACPLMHTRLPPWPLDQIYSVESHRLALALDRRGALVQIVRSAILQARGMALGRLRGAGLQGCRITCCRRAAPESCAPCLPLRATPLDQQPLHSPSHSFSRRPWGSATRTACGWPTCSEPLCSARAGPAGGPQQQCCGARAHVAPHSVLLLCLLPRLPGSHFQLITRLFRAMLLPRPN